MEMEKYLIYRDDLVNDDVNVTRKGSPCVVHVLHLRSAKRNVKNVNQDGKYDRKVNYILEII